MLVLPLVKKLAVETMIGVSPFRQWVGRSVIVLIRSCLLQLVYANKWANQQIHQGGGVICAS